MSRRAQTPPLPETLIHGPKACRDRPSHQEMHEFKEAWKEWKQQGRRKYQRPVPPPDWFDEDQNSMRGREAKRICLQECPVIEDCIAYTQQFANSEQPMGIWGGLSQTERGRRRRRR